MIEIDSLCGLRGVRHGFFTREGGVSEGIFASLNCGFGSGDVREHVVENRARAARRLGLDPAALVTAFQFHSPTVVQVERPWQPDEAPQADALVTRTAGVALAVLSADCVPVLFADAAAGIVGAAHAGWKGTLTGVLEATLAAMTALGASLPSIRAAIGPAIQQNSYEVGPEFPPRFAEQDVESAAYFRALSREGRFLLDLPGYVEHRLRRSGLRHVGRAVDDTMSDETRFFSYRRTTLRGETAYGRGISLIALAP